MSKVINFPFGPAAQQTLADAATMTQNIQSTLTKLVKTGGFGQAVTGLSLLADPALLIGSRVVVRVEQGATGRNLAFGAAGSTIVAPALVGVANDIDVIELEWTGAQFEAVTVWNKVYDAA